MPETDRNTPTLITSGFAERVGMMLLEWETQSGLNGAQKRQTRSLVDVPVRITAVYDDYLAGKIWDFETEDTVGSTIYVAKPYDMQRTPFDGQTIGGVAYVYSSATARTADGDNETITPAYVVAVESGYDGDLIWCHPSATGLLDPDGTRITLRDLNEAGRAFLGDSSGSLTVLKFDGTRSGKRYTGHVWNDDGTQGASVQFRFVNDPGTAALLGANEYVMAMPCPAWDAGNAAWSGSDAKYWAVLSPWAAFA